MRAAERALAEAAETHKPVGFIMVDIDYFKQINDNFGHAVGDAALKEFTRRLAGRTCQTDQLGRYGGEEFLIILGGAATDVFDMRTAERLREAIVTAPFQLGGEARSVSASFGAALSNGVSNESCTGPGRRRRPCALRCKEWRSEPHRDRAADWCSRQSRSTKWPLTSEVGPSLHLQRCEKVGRYWTNNGQILILARESEEPNDPYRHFAVGKTRDVDALTGEVEERRLRRLGHAGSCAPFRRV